MSDRSAVLLIAAIVVAAIAAGIAFSRRPGMLKLALGIDRLSTFVGQCGSWAIILLTAAIVYDVTARRFFRAPTDWGYDASYMLYGTLFMLAGAYALSRNGHVR